MIRYFLGRLLSSWRYLLAGIRRPQPRNELTGLAQGAQFTAVGQRDRIVEGAMPPFFAARVASILDALADHVRQLGSVSSLMRLLHTGQGSPGAPQPQARGPSQDLSGWASQTDRQLSQRVQNLKRLVQAQSRQRPSPPPRRRKHALRCPW